MKDSNREFFSLLGITVVGMTIEFLTTLTDQLVASHMLGEDALAGVGLAHPVGLAAEVFTAIFYAGAGVRLLAAKGTGSETAVRKVFSTAFATALIGGAVLGALVWCFRQPIALFFSAYDLPTYNCIAYLRCYSLALALAPLEGLMLEVLYLEEDLSLCLVLMPARLVVNAVVSAVLCHRIGVAGIALGSVVASVAGLAIGALHFLRRDNAVRLGVVFSPGELRRIVRGSAGDLAYPLFEMAVATAITRLAIGWFGAGTLPVVTVVVDIVTFTVLFEGFGQAAVPIIGRACAGRDFATVNGTLRTASLTLFATAAAAGAALVCFPGALLTAMGVDDPALRATGTPAVRAMGLALAGIGFVRLFNTCYQYVNRPGVAFWLTFLGGLAAPLALPCAVGTGHGFAGFITGFALAPYLGIAVFTAGLLLFRRGRTFPLLLSDDSAADGEDVASLRSRTRLPFRITRGRVALAGAVVYVLTMGTLYGLWTERAVTVVEQGLRNIEERFVALGAKDLSADELRYQADRTFVTLDNLGWVAVLSEDGESVDMPDDPAEHGRNLFEIGLDRAAVDTHRTHRAVVAGLDVNYRIMTAGRRRVLAMISDFDVFWERDRQLTVVGIMLLLIIAAIVFIVAANPEEPEKDETEK